MTTLVSNPAGDFFDEWNPDGTAFVYGSMINDSTTYFYKNSRLFIYDMKTKASREIAQDIDELRNVAGWSKSGLYLSAQDKTKQKLYAVDLKTGATKPVSIPLDILNSISFSKNTDEMALTGRNYADLNEVFSWKLNEPLKKISNNNAQIAGWNTPVNENHSVESKDEPVLKVFY